MYLATFGLATLDIYIFISSIEWREWEEGAHPYYLPLCEYIMVYFNSFSKLPNYILTNGRRDILLENSVRYFDMFLASKLWSAIDLTFDALNCHLTTKLHLWRDA
jgi:hypothetical protein